MLTPKAASTLPLRPLGPVTNLGAFEGRRKRLAAQERRASLIQTIASYAVMIGIIAFAVLS